MAVDDHGRDDTVERARHLGSMSTLLDEQLGAWRRRRMAMGGACSRDALTARPLEE
jgi:hypothetical protein